MKLEEIFAGESKNLEFKESLPAKSSKYMKTIVAFANGQGGKLIIGVEDDTKKIVGIDKNEAFKIMDAIANAISDSCKPAIIPDIYMQTVNEATVIIVDIEAGRQDRIILPLKVCSMAFMCALPEPPDQQMRRW